MRRFDTSASLPQPGERNKFRGPGVAAIGLLLCTAMAVQAQQPMDALRARIEALRPAKVVWREIQWIDCPLEALRQSREQRKPVIVWVFLGNPKDERC